MKPDDRVALTNIEERSSLVKNADIPKDFQRNSGQAESIWGKWLQEKLQNKNYEQITARMIDFVNTMPDANTIKSNLENNASSFRAIDYTQENFKKEFPDNSVTTPLGEFELGEDFFNKLGRREGRSELLGIVKPTLSNPDYIVIDVVENTTTGKREYGTLFLKAYKRRSEIIYLGVIKEVSTTSGKAENLVISFHEAEKILKKLARAKMLLYQNAEKFNEVSNALVRTSGNAGNIRNFMQNENAGRLVFNMQNDSDTVNPEGVNEIWGEFISVGKTRVRKIRYNVEGFEISVDDGDFALKKYSEIDNYRKGVLMQ